MTTVELKIVHTTEPSLVATRQRARAHVLLEAFLDADDAGRGQAFWAFYRMLDPGLNGVPSPSTKGDTHDHA